jgi:hypothetical protein
VGSSFELGQRLDEPINLRSRRSSRQLLRQGILTPPSLSTMHIFDINRTSTSLNTWREFEMKDRGLSAALKNLDSKSSSPQTEGLKKPDGDLKVHVDASDDAARLKELDDERQRWFWACNPPRMVPVQAPAHSSRPESDAGTVKRVQSSVTVEPVLESVSREVPQFRPVNAPHASSLTLEAEKQVRENRSRRSQPFTNACPRPKTPLLSFEAGRTLPLRMRTFHQHIKTDGHLTIKMDHSQLQMREFCPLIPVISLST